MSQKHITGYDDQFDYLADCFELIRKRGDAFNIRGEALETERMVQYGEGTGLLSERSRLLEIYREIEAEVTRREDLARQRKETSDRRGIRFPIDAFIARHELGEQETQILLVLLFNESQGRTQARFSTGGELLNLLHGNPVTALRASQLLDPDAPLLSKGIIRQASEEENGSVLRSHFEVTETTLHEVLGIAGRHPVENTEHSASTASVPASPYRVIEPRVTLDDVVLSEEERCRLDEVVWQAGEGRQILQGWGLEDVLEKGRGTIVLFQGPPGTGKTMAAEAIAHRLERPLFVADYSQLESKWIGETEKNIVSVFRAAEEGKGLLLLDEADAILASRLDGGHYNDRAYNRQVSVLFSELESFEGVVILTSNRAVTLDHALARRISAQFEFKIPGARERARIWKRLLPERVPLTEDVNIKTLADQYAMAGGHIKNAILAAARRAAIRDGSQARLRHSDLEEAAKLERQSFIPGRPIGFGKRPGSQAAYA